jgi:hypothetical protein
MSHFSNQLFAPRIAQLTRVTDTGVVYLDTDFVGFGRGNLDVFDDQILAGLPGDGGLDKFSCCGRTGGDQECLPCR